MRFFFAVGSLVYFSSSLCGCGSDALSGETDAGAVEPVSIADASSDDAGSDAEGADASTCTYGATYCSGSFCFCAIRPPSPNCITADTNGTPGDQCDDGNPCTQDVADPAAPGGCKHLWFAWGETCSVDGTMVCANGGTGMECCPADQHPLCTVEGARGECASGSNCLEGMCWLSCATDKDCTLTGLGPHCVAKSVGHVTIHTCGN